MSDFESIMKNHKLGEVEEPKPLPEGSYSAIIKSTKSGHTQKNNTPYVRVEMQISEPLEDVDEADIEQAGGPSKIMGKVVRTDFYITEDALFMLQRFIMEHVGITEEVSFDEALLMLANQPVGVKIAHSFDDKDSSKVYANVVGTFAV